MEEKLTQLYLKSDVFLLACVFEKFLKVTVNEFGINCIVSVYQVILGNVV